MMSRCGVMGAEARPIGVAEVALSLVIACSAAIGALTLTDEVDAMEDEWVYVNVDSFGDELQVMGASIGSNGTIICYAWPHGTERGFTAIDRNGTLLWRAITNACPGITEGPDGGYYYVDWNTSDPYSASWSNLTALSPNGEFRWNYVVSVGTLELWAVYPDGHVIVHNYDWQNDLVDRIIAVSDDGSELWTLDIPFADADFCLPWICENGTFSVIAQEGGSRYLLGVTEDGTQAYIEEGEFLAEYAESTWDRNETVWYMVMQELLDNGTSVITVSAHNRLTGAVEWETILHHSDNLGDISPGVSRVETVVTDSEGRIYCGDIVDRYSYSLSPNGSILWERPYVGIIIDAFPSGGCLVHDEDSISRLDSDGSLIWRHHVDLDGYSFVLRGSDDTVYYSYLGEVHALVHSVGVDWGGIVIVTLLVVDGAAIAAYVKFRVLKSR